MILTSGLDRFDSGSIGGADIKWKRFSAATRTSIIRMASDIDIPSFANVADAPSFTDWSTRTWIVVVEGIVVSLLSYIDLEDAP